MKAIWNTIKTGGSEFIEDDAMTQAAALAFYTALSFAPLMILLLWAVSFLGEGTQDRLVAQVGGLVGAQAGEVVKTIETSAEEQPPSARTLAGVIGILVLLFSASGVFAQMQSSLNWIWDVEAKPGQGIWGWLRKRLLSVGMVFALLFLLMVSLAVSFALTEISQRLGGEGVLWDALYTLGSLAVFTLLFALIFKFIPDVTIPWRHVWLGAAFTAILFTIGKWAIGFYLGNSAVTTSYGTAGSLLALLVWVYYSAIIVFFGAELTQAYARLHGARLEPDEHAQWIGEGHEHRGRPAVQG